MIGKLRLRIIAGPVAMAILIVSSGWVLWNGVGRSKEASMSVEHTYRVLIASENFLSTLREMESAVRAYVLTHNGTLVSSYQDAREKQRQRLDDLDRLTSDNPKQHATLRRIRALSARRVEILDQAEQETRAGHSLYAGNAVPLGEGPKLMSELTDAVHEFEDEEHHLLNVRTDAANNAVAWTRSLLILTSTMLAMVLFFAGIAIERYVRGREESREVLQRQADLINFSHDAVVTLDPKGVITGWNAGAVEVYGWTSAEAVGKPAQEILRADSGDLQKVTESLTKTGRWDGELTQTTKNGSRRIVGSRIVQVRNRQGLPVGVLNITRDETQRREAEDLLRQVAEQRRLALDAAQLGSWDYDVRQDRLTWDERCRDIMGLPGLGPAKFEQAFKVIYPDDIDSTRTNALHALSSEGDGRFVNEMRIKLRDGSIRWVATSGRVYFEEVDGAKQPVRVIGLNSDITERKRVEEALRESEDKLRVALETGRIGVFNEFVNEGKLVFDDRAKELLGLDQQEEVEPMEFFNRLHPEDREKMISIRSKDLTEGESDQQELGYRIRHKNGNVRWIVVRRRVYSEGEGTTRKTQRVLGVLLDITDQKRAEMRLIDALEESDRERQRLAAILQTMPAGVVLVDRDSKLLECNAEAIQIWRAGDFAGLASRLNELRGWRADSGEPVQPHEWPRFRALHGESVVGEIFDIERFDASEATVFNSASPVVDAAGVIHGAVGVMVDITERRQVELALRRSEESLRKAHNDLEKMLEQKNILFQEVQHRVKNNLQIVSSLLSLEAQRFEDSAFHNALNESRDRIRSMALMHEKFYHLDDLARIEFGDYVDELARYFFSSYIAEPAMVGFSSDVDVKLTMGSAIPCGLILQELLSNSVKHSFPQGKGDIRIDFHSKDGAFRMKYWDSGPGLPPTVDLHHPGTLGLQLVTDLADQLQGKIAYEYNKGAQFTLTFSG